MEKIISSLKIHLSDISKCHRAAFPNSLSSALGQNYTESMLSWYISTDKTFLFHIMGDNDKVIGYCGGMISDGTLGTGSSSGMAQHSFYAAIVAFLSHPWVLFHTEVRAKWPVLWKNLLMKLGIRPQVHFSSEQKRARSKDPQVGLVVIGVDPAFQGKGFGSILLNEFERRAVEDYGIRKLQLTVLADNAQAIRAYERNGWVKGKLEGKSLSMYKNVDKG